MNLGISEILFLFFLALLIFGPKRLPEISRQIGKALAEFRRASNEFKAQLEDEMRQVEIEAALRKEKENGSIVRALPSPAGTVLSGSLTPGPPASPNLAGWGEKPAEPSALPPPPGPAVPAPKLSDHTGLQSDLVKGTDA